MAFEKPAISYFLKSLAMQDLDLISVMKFANKVMSLTSNCSSDSVFGGTIRAIGKTYNQLVKNSSS